jgi:hypothetical protein
MKEIVQNLGPHSGVIFSANEIHDRPHIDPKKSPIPVSNAGPFDLLDIPKLKHRIESCGGDFGFELHPDNTAILKASWPLAHDHH